MHQILSHNEKFQKSTKKLKLTQKERERERKTILHSLHDLCNCRKGRKNPINYLFCYIVLSFCIFIQLFSNFFYLAPFFIFSLVIRGYVIRVKKNVLFMAGRILLIIETRFKFIVPHSITLNYFFRSISDNYLLILYSLCDVNIISESFANNNSTRSREKQTLISKFLKTI